MGVEKYRAGGAETVKSRAIRSPRCPRSASFVAAVVVALALTSASANAKRPKNEPALLLGGASMAPERRVDTDPLLPHGVLRPTNWGSWASPPDGAVCSVRRPVCVVAPERALGASALDLLEDAYETVVFGIALPRPDGSPAGSLFWHLEEADFTLEVELRPRIDFDRGRVRCRGGSLSSETALRCVLEASHGTLAPATAPLLARGAAVSAAASLRGSSTLEPWVRRRLVEPERGTLTSSFPEWVPERSALFFSFVEERSESTRAGETPAFLLGLTATSTPPGALRYESEPDVVDVLRRTLHEERATYARFLDRFARATLGLGTDEFLPGFPERLRPRYAWDIDGASLPRNLVLPRALEPTGSAYVRVSLPESLRERTLVFKATCEAPIRSVWSVVLEDATGRPTRIVEIPFVESATSHGERITVDRNSASATLVGTNLDWVDLAHPFDPDHGPHEAHTCTVYVLTLEADASPRSPD